MAVKVGMVSLGCSKNQVDGEIMLSLIQQDGYELCADPALCDVVIINTCGFIEDAKRESIENILEFCERKRAGQILVGFAAETDDLESNALRKMREKNFDWIAANEVGKPGRGFASDNNALTLYAADGRRFNLELKPKKVLAGELLSLILNPL